MLTRAFLVLLALLTGLSTAQAAGGAQLVSALSSVQAGAGDNACESQRAEQGIHPGRPEQGFAHAPEMRQLRRVADPLPDTPVTRADQLLE